MLTLITGYTWKEEKRGGGAAARGGGRLHHKNARMCLAGADTGFWKGGGGGDC